MHSSVPTTVGREGDAAVRSERSRDSAELRRGEILRLLHADGRVRVTELCARYAVSEVCIRRDLTILEERGLLLRFHGGAQTITPANQILPVAARAMQNQQTKRRIGALAAQRIRLGDTILLDAGSTVLEVAKHIPQSMLLDGSLTVVTRSLSIAAELRRHANLRLIVTGGVYSQKDDAFHGTSVEAMLNSIHVDVAFVGVDAVSLNAGLTTDDFVEAQFGMHVANRAHRVIGVTDSSKIGREFARSYLPIQRLHAFVTDEHAPADFLDAMRRQGVQVEIAYAAAASTSALCPHADPHGIDSDVVVMHAHDL
jgi:DeoR/GlpR family transcriptional regulator of sugar metabolism